MATEGIADSRD